jgi:hypothetical protein
VEVCSVPQNRKQIISPDAFSQAFFRDIRMSHEIRRNAIMRAGMPEMNRVLA